MTEKPFSANIEDILRFLPHRAPFLLLDRILEIHSTGELKDLSPNNKIGTRVVAVKSVSFNEPYFQGHFPGRPIMPGVLVVETMAQAASFSIYPYLYNAASGFDEFRKLAEGFQCMLVGADSVRFRRPIVPGDSIRIETVVTKARGKLWAFECKATVDGHLAAEAEIMLNLTMEIL